MSPSIYTNILIGVGHTTVDYSVTSTDIVDDYEGEYEKSTIVYTVAQGGTYTNIAKPLNNSKVSPLLQSSKLLPYDRRRKYIHKHCIKRTRSRCF